ncbi:MAG: hypothetical protein Q8933_11765 [Bacteroidota bacterium]|nr:hypothetical protein [Bacteroidota bacterium]MDP4192749.1 hypothetical protein [Bacteroidota bacterium]MDP4195829.1 hypothetical protein [Bacteroidota bacterium]
MITAFIFFVHLVFITVIFTKKWQTEGISQALINAALIIILFSVGWSIATMAAKVAVGPKGWGLYFDRDAFALTLLSIAEYFFYKMYYTEKPVPGASDEDETVTEDDKEKQL